MTSNAKTHGKASAWWLVGSFAGAAGIGALWYWKTHSSGTPVYVSLGGGSSSPGLSASTSRTSSPIYHYTVQPGDTLSGIAFCTGTTVAALQQRNHIRDANLIRVGQVLVVPHPCSGSALATSTNGSGSTGSVSHPPQLVVAGAELAGG